MPNLCRNSHLESPLPLFFYVKIFRSSAIAPASPLIRNSTTLRWTLWCSHYCVAKRQQFSCPLGTATLLLKVENVVPGFWICSFSYCGKVFFFLLLHQWAVVLVRTSIFEESVPGAMQRFFLALRHYKHRSAFCPHLVVFEARLMPIVASMT